MVAKGEPFRPEAQAAFLELGRHALEGGFAHTLLRAVFAGWLIALMVWLLPTSGSARPLIIMLLTYMVSLGKLSHVIAGSSEAAFAVMAGGAPWADYLLRFLLPTLIGNTIGGVLLVAIVNHAQVTSELAGARGQGWPGGPGRRLMVPGCALDARESACGGRCSSTSTPWAVPPATCSRRPCSTPSRSMPRPPSRPLARSHR